MVNVKSIDPVNEEGFTIEVYAKQGGIQVQISSTVLMTAGNFHFTSYINNKELTIGYTISQANLHQAIQEPGKYQKYVLLQASNITTQTGNNGIISIQQHPRHPHYQIGIAAIAAGVYLADLKYGPRQELDLLNRLKGSIGAIIDSIRMFLLPEGIIVNTQYHPFGNYYRCRIAIGSSLTNKLRGY